MHPIETSVYEYLSNVIDQKQELDEQLVHEFGERCKDSLRKKVTDLKEQSFRLRMSNVGRPLRQLMLEKLLGRSKPSPSFILKMLLGSMYEALFLLLLKGSGAGLQDYDQAVSLNLAGMKLEGTYDIKINGKIYDVKTASEYAYKSKFNSWKDVLGSDDFGYGAQGFAYGLADGVPFGGWLVINKSTGDFKVIELPEEEFHKLKDEYAAKIADTITAVNENHAMPPCEGVIEETYYKKKTGNKMLGNSCRFCPSKSTCHPNIMHTPSKVSKTGKYEYYVELADEQETNTGE